MSYKEAAVVKDMERRFEFSDIEWLDLESFKSKLESSQQIYPHINSIDNEKCYIGKSIANDEYFECFGCVKKNNDGDWELSIQKPYMQLRICKEEFVILTLNGPNSYYWKNTGTPEMMPKYSLRFFKLRETFNGICTIATNICNETVQPSSVNGDSFELEQPNEFYQNANRQKQKKNFSVVPNIGQINPSNGLLYVCEGEEVETYEKYSVLCLKPSPALLKSLCRLVIRKCAGHRNANISKLNIPNALVSYLKYPSHLYKGECMINGDRIVSEDGNYELEISRNRLRFNSFLPKKKEEGYFIRVESINLLSDGIVLARCNSRLLDVLWKNIDEEYESIDKRMFYRIGLVLLYEDYNMKKPHSNVEVYNEDKNQFEEKGYVDYYYELVLNLMDRLQMSFYYRGECNWYDKDNDYFEEAGNKADYGYNAYMKAFNYESDDCNVYAGNGYDDFSDDDFEYLSTRFND